jgi:hypothetical protein
MTVDYKLHNRKLLSFKDIMTDSRINDPLYSFTRELGLHIYIYEDGELILKKIKRLTPSLQQDKKRIAYYRNENFITMDLETKSINNIIKPISISMYDGKTIHSSFITNYKNSEEMLTCAIASIMKSKYHNYRVYFHNLSYFDGIFLFKILITLSDKVVPIIRDDKMIEIRLYYGKYINNKGVIKYKYILYFRDSLLLLPSSLKQLAINFNVENKDFFPYDFINNSNVSLDYIGQVPDIKYFNNITTEEYNNYCEEFKDKM